MIKIPRFSQSEIEGITHLLGEEGIPFVLEGTTTGISHFGGITEYLVIVEEKDFVDTLSLLMIHFRITEEDDEPFSGTCPACGTEVPGAINCPDCGLSFSIETPESMKGHPFYLFLKENALLKESEP